MTEKGLRCQHWQATTPHDHRCPHVPSCPVTRVSGPGQRGAVGNGLGTTWGQQEQRGGNGDSTEAMALTRGETSLWLSWPRGEGLPAALLPILLPAGSCHPPATSWRKITAEIPTRTSGARGVTPSTPTSGTRAAASRSVRTVSATGQGHPMLCVPPTAHLAPLAVGSRLHDLQWGGLPWHRGPHRVGDRVPALGPAAPAQAPLPP